MRKFLKKKAGLNILKENQFILFYFNCGSCKKKHPNEQSSLEQTENSEEIVNDDEAGQGRRELCGVRHWIT